MSYYQLLQKGANVLKPLIKEASDKRTKAKYISALIIKSILCIAFCMLFVTTFTNLFGAENSIVGVITVIGVLTYRLSNLGFNVKQSALAILGVYGIYIIFPYLASISNPFLGAIINFVALMVIVILTCYDIRLSNQSIFILGYFLLYGYKVTSIDSLISRGIALIVGGLLVSSIFYIISRKTIYEATFRDVI